MGNTDVDSAMGGIDFTQDGATNNSRIGFFTQVAGGASTERLRINSKGAIGFGTVPPTDTHTGWNQFFIGQKGSLFSENATGTHGLDGMIITDNLYVDSDTGSFANIETNESSAYKQEGGVHTFHSQASGSAGAAVTLSEKMRIDSTGHVLINKSASDGNMLQVHGNVTVTDTATSGKGGFMRHTQTTVAAGSTGDIFRFLDDAGNVINANTTAGVFYITAVNTTGGGNQSQRALNYLGSGNGAASFTLDQVTTNVRGTDPVSSYAMVADGSGGPAKLQATTISGQAAIIDVFFTGIVNSN
jgi:hypothetical protein